MRHRGHAERIVERPVAPAAQNAKCPMIEIGRDGVESADAVHVAERDADGGGQRDRRWIGKARAPAAPDDELVCEAVAGDDKVVSSVAVEIAGRYSDGAVTDARVRGYGWQDERGRE